MDWKCSLHFALTTIVDIEREILIIEDPEIKKWKSLIKASHNKNKKQHTPTRWLILSTSAPYLDTRGQRSFCLERVSGRRRQWQKRRTNKFSIFRRPQWNKLGRCARVNGRLIVSKWDVYCFYTRDSLRWPGACCYLLRARHARPSDSFHFDAPAEHSAASVAVAALS